MSTARKPVPRHDALAFFRDLKPPRADFLADVLAGLAARPRRLPPKYLYDARGARLFEAICETPEYYLTRTEIALLQAAGPQIARFIGPQPRIVEWGAGASRKIRTLIDALDAPEALALIDISAEQLEDAARDLAVDHPDLAIGAIVADFTQAVRLPEAFDGPGRLLGFFPGSTIGNLPPEESRRLMALFRETLGQGGALLIGVDLVKDRATLEAAYDDAAGISAAFAKNLLNRLRRELGAQLDPGGFDYRAPWNADVSAIEMQLVARGNQRIALAGEVFEIADGEAIHTEDSRKFTVAGFQALACDTGFAPRAVWQDDAGLFSLHLLEAR